MQDKRSETSNINANAVEVQQLVIRILTILSETECKKILEDMDTCAEDPPREEVKAYLRLCIGMSSELRLDPCCYDGLEKICKTILCRQKGKGSVQKKEYGDLMKVNNMQRYRLEKRKASLTSKQVYDICSGFKKTVDKRFWENQLFGWDPSISSAGRKDGPEREGFEFLYRSLNEQQIRSVEDRLDEAERQRLEAIAAPVSYKPSVERFGDTPDRLYPVINALALQGHLLIPYIAEEELGIRINTWYAWRRDWTNAEEKGFQNGVPKNRLKRIHIMILSVLFELSYLESVYFLGLSGYYFSPGEPDDTILRYFKHSIPSSIELKDHLQKGLYNGMW